MAAVWGGLAGLMRLGGAGRALRVTTGLLLRNLMFWNYGNLIEVP